MGKIKREPRELSGSLPREAGRWHYKPVWPSARNALNELIGIDRPKGQATAIFNRDDMRITRQSRLS